MGKTSGRGSKGQKARGKVPASFTGGGLPLYKKLPYKRGLGNRKVSEKPVLVTLTDLNKFKAKATVTLESLIEQGIVEQKQVAKRGVKILATGELKTVLNVEKVPISQKAKEAILKQGGKIA